MEALAKGWAGWTQQATELHTFRTDHENRTKAGKGFFKLNNESIAAVREDLAADYQASTPPISESGTEETPDSAPIPVPDTTPPTTPLPTSTTTPPQPESCPNATMELSAQLDLTTEPTTTPMAEPTPEPEPSETLHTNETASIETKAVAPDLPPVTTPTTDPTLPEPSIPDIFDDT